MMLTKKQVLSVVRDMPGFFDKEQLFDRIVLIDKVEEGRNQLKAGGRVSTEAVSKKIKRYLR